MIRFRRLLVAFVIMIAGCLMLTLQEMGEVFKAANGGQLTSLMEPPPKFPGNLRANSSSSVASVDPSIKGNHPKSNQNLDLIQLQNMSNANQTLVSLNLQNQSIANQTLEPPKELPPPRDHPHAGARYPNGTWGYVADVTRIRRWMMERYRNQTSNSDSNAEPPLSYMPIDEINYTCGQSLGKGNEFRGWKILSQKVKVDGPNPMPINNTVPPTKYPFDGKILCGVYTYEAMHERLSGVVETWGWRCDGFFAASTKTIEDPTDIGYGAIDLPHLGPESYSNMWQKTRSILSFMHDNYLEDYDYFYLSGDDTHLIVENLRNYLALWENEQRVGGENATLFVGVLFPHDRVKIFVAGGGGYVLNRFTLKQLVRNIFPNCLPFVQISAEDRMVSTCLQKINVWGTDAADARGEQRFHPMDPAFAHNFNGKRGYYSGPYKLWAQKYGFKVGMNVVSSQTIAFHMLRYKQIMKRHHAILYRSCPRGTILGDELARIDGNRTIS